MLKIQNDIFFTTNEQGGSPPRTSWGPINFYGAWCGFSGCLDFVGAENQILNEFLPTSPISDDGPNRLCSWDRNRPITWSPPQNPNRPCQLQSIFPASLYAKLPALNLFFSQCNSSAACNTSKKFLRCWFVQGGCYSSVMNFNCMCVYGLGCRSNCSYHPSYLWWFLSQIYLRPTHPSLSLFLSDDFLWVCDILVFEQWAVRRLWIYTIKRWID